ncbi:MAG: ankyrin repeat domain-containing protein [Fuerstiella sp.]|nr:ankyrin repeat domain-containing protein [Fuerstiella sp.]
MARPGRPRKHDPVTDDIRRCIQNADDDGARALLTANEVDIPDGYSCTPVIWASFHNRPELLKWTIERGANINHQDRNGYCPLHYVGQEKLAEVAAVLLDAGAETELRDIHGNTPLWTATFNARGDLSVVRLLVAHGASFENKNNAGKTVRDMAEIFFPDELPSLIRAAT